MAITWAQARGKVRGDLWRPGANGVPDDVCDRALHAALLELESERRWLWLENIRHSTALLSDTNKLPLPPDLSTITSIAFVREDGEAEEPLILLTVGRVRIMASQSSGRWPRAYALTDRDAYLDCTAPAGAAFDLVYTARTPDDLSDALASGDTNITLRLHQATIIAGACAHVAATYLKNEGEEARQRRVYERGVARLFNIEDEVRGDAYGGMIQPDAAYSDMARGYC